MNFRVIYHATQTILLERIDEETTSKILVSVYLDNDHRFDEWIDCENIVQLQVRIAEYTSAQAHDFLAKALAWFNSQFPVQLPNA